MHHALGIAANREHDDLRWHDRRQLPSLQPPSQLLNTVACMHETITACSCDLLNVHRADERQDPLPA